MRAASMNSVGTALIADEKITMANPVWIQISTTISHMLLNGGSWMKLIGLASTAPVVGVVDEPADPRAEEAVDQVGDDDGADAR